MCCLRCVPNKLTCLFFSLFSSTDDDDDGDDDLQQQGINLSNVIGRRTRGVVIDYAKAAAENPVDDDEDEDDGDFEEPDDMEED